MPRRAIQCDYEGCTRSYCSSFNLKRHIESSHFGIRKFKCPICGRQLSSKQNLIDHQNIHSGAKPYVCDIPECNMKFRQLSQYYLHKQLHAEVANQIDNNYSINQLYLPFLSRKLTMEVSTTKAFIPKLEDKDESVKLPEISIPQQGVCLPLHPKLQ